MGEFNVDKTTGDLIDTAGMPDTYPASQVTYGNGSVKDALDGLQIKSVIFNETTSANGRITGKFVGMKIIVLKAHCVNESHIVLPFTYETSSSINTGFKILNSENMSAVANTAVQLKVFYIAQ